MTRPNTRDRAIDLIFEALVLRLEASTELAISAPAKNAAQQRQRWIKLDRYAADIAALTRSLQILDR